MDFWSLLGTVKRRTYCVPGPLQHVACYTSRLILQNSPILHNVPPVEAMFPYPKQRKCEMFLCKECIQLKLLSLRLDHDSIDFNHKQLTALWTTSTRQKLRTVKTSSSV